MDAERMARLWEAMAGVYGHKWTATYGLTPAQGMAGRAWAAGLRAMSPEQVRRGLDACINRGDEWPPSLPAFKQMCLGIPKMAAAKDAALGRPAPEVDRRFLRLMCSFLDMHRLRTLHADKADRLLGEAFDRAKDHLMAGGDLPDEPVPLPPPEPDPRREHEIAMARMDALRRAMLEAKPKGERHGSSGDGG